MSTSSNAVRRSRSDVAPETDEREPFAAFLADEVSRQAVLRAVERRGWSAGEVEVGGLAAAMRTLGVVSPARIMLVDISGDEDTPEALDAMAELRRQGAVVIAAGSVNDVHVFRRTLGAGAIDYLVKPISADSVEEALDRALQGHAPGDLPARQGRCMAFVGARGGVGASTLVAAFAWIAADHLRRRVALVDLDLQFGCQGLLFDQQPGRGLRDALEDPDRVDALFLERAVTRPTPQLHLLATEEGLDQQAATSGESVGHLLAELRAVYDLILIDLPRRTLVEHQPALTQITDVVLVGNVTLPALRDINRLTRFLRTAAPELALHLVVNHAESSRRNQVPRQAFAKALELPVDAELPFDAAAASRSLNAGQPLPAAVPRSPVTTGLSRFGAQLLGAPPRRRGLFRMLRR